MRIFFSLLYKDTQTVTVTANNHNNSGIGKTYYYFANGETTVYTGVSWTELDNYFSIAQNNKYPYQKKLPVPSMMYCCF